MRKSVASAESKRDDFKNIVLRFFLPAIILGFLIWHTTTWNTNGIYYEMLYWNNGNEYKTVLYNLTLIVITGTMLSILMKELTNAAINGMHKLNNKSNKRQGTR